MYNTVVIRKTREPIPPFKKIKNTFATKLQIANESKTNGFFKQHSRYQHLILALVLYFFQQGKFILLIVPLMIRLHFIQKAKNMNRKVDYLVAYLPIISAGATL